MGRNRARAVSGARESGRQSKALAVSRARQPSRQPKTRARLQALSLPQQDLVVPRVGVAMSRQVLNLANKERGSGGGVRSSEYSNVGFINKHRACQNVY
jgi:hypothetical protein